MTREQLDAIRARVAWLEENGGIGLPFAEARALLDEVERLKAREEALVQQSVAQIGLSGWQYKQIERLTAERDAAFKRGAAAMREAAADLFEGTADKAGLATMPTWAEFIRALPDPEDK